VFGDGGGSEAIFGSNTTLEAQTALTATSKSAPACVKEGFTAETNNLKLPTLRRSEASHHPRWPPSRPTAQAGLRVALSPADVKLCGHNTSHAD